MMELLDALAQKRLPSIGAADNLRTMALLEAAVRSSQEKRPIKLTEITETTP